MKYKNTEHNKIQQNNLYSVYIYGFLATIAVVMPTYINSNFLKNHVSEDSLSYVYSFGSILTIILLLFFNKFLNKLGNYKINIILLLSIISSLFILANSINLYFIITFFIIFMTSSMLLAISIDIFLEHNSTNSETGKIRGIFMTLINIGWVISPTITGAILDGTNNYDLVYSTACFALIPALLIAFFQFRNFKDKEYIHLPVRDSYRHIKEDKNISAIFLANIILNTFYAYMTIYVSIYLHETLGFSWSDLSLVFTFMLIPFIVLDIPLGKLADSKYGEKEMMTLGFVILGASTIVLGLYPIANIYYWAGMLFITRIGASIVEIMIETYFFKKVPERDSSMLALFRSTRSLAFIIGPILYLVLHNFMDFSSSIMILGLICLFGIRYSLFIKDTK